MDILTDYLRDPIVSAVIIIVITLIAVVALRTRPAVLEASRKRKETTLLLVSGLGIYLLLSALGMVTLNQSVFFPSEQSSTHPVSTISQTPTGPLVSTPTVVPTPTPALTPTPLPVLSRSITQELTTFCDAIANRDYQTAWGQYAMSLQQQHTQADVIDVWRHFTGCHVLGGDGDPTIWSVLDISMETGYVDQYGFTGSAPYRFTMQVENATWKIAHVCHQISEECLTITWG